MILSFSILTQSFGSLGHDFLLPDLARRERLSDVAAHAAVDFAVGGVCEGVVAGGPAPGEEGGEGGGGG